MPFSDTRGFVLSAAACAVVLALSGCGGGGGSASTTPPPGRSMAQPDPEPVALPEGVTLATAGTFTIEPGESVNRDGARFTCAAGGPACAVVVVERAGGGYAATATGGEVMVAAAQIPAPPGGGGQPGGMEEDGLPFPDWPVADAAAARSLVGGSALSWSPSDIENRENRFSRSDYGGTRWDSRHQTDDPYVGSPSSLHCYDPPNNCNVERQPVMTYPHGGIPIVQRRAVDFLPAARDLTPTTYYRRQEVSIGSILDHGAFMVHWIRVYDTEFGQRVPRFGLTGDSGLADIFIPDSSAASFNNGPVPTGRWEGVLLGTGNTNSPTSPLYRQFIIGDVDVTVRLSPTYDDDEHRRATVEFSNVRNINTGTSVTLSHTQWEEEGIQNSIRRARTGAINTPGTFDMYFRGPNDEEVFGVFETEEALGAFGARKQ